MRVYKNSQLSNAVVHGHRILSWSPKALLTRISKVPPGRDAVGPFSFNLQCHLQDGQYDDYILTGTLRSVLKVQSHHLLDKTFS